MKIADIVKYISAKEGLKKKVTEGNIREIVGIVSDLCAAADPETFIALVRNGQARAKRKKTK